MKHPKLFFGNMVIARSMCVPLLAFAGCDPHGPAATTVAQSAANGGATTREPNSGSRLALS